MATIDEKRLAVARLRAAFARIAADFSEAYEQCRNDAQRKALEIAHRMARQADLRTREDDALEDRDGWRRMHADFRVENARTERKFAVLGTATAVERILRRLAAIEAQIAVLGA